MSEKPTKHTKVLIIGSGPAGYTAAVYAARAMLKPILVYGSEPGGQLTTTTDVENYPGFAKAIQGPWLMDQMKEQALAVGTEMIEDHISSVKLKSKPFEAVGDGGQKYTADSIIISTGAQARWLNLKSEQEFRGFGVSACATCDGFFFKDKEVAVVGGGNAAVEEAMFLTKFASKVKLIHRRDKLRAEKLLQTKLMENKKIEIIWDSVVEEVIGDDKFGWFKNYDSSGIITAQDIVIMGKPFTSPVEMYLVIVAVVTPMTLLAMNMARGSTGRNWMSVRDMDIAAESMGVSLLKTKLQAFAISSFYCGVAGALFAFTYLKSLEPVAFDIKLSFKVLFMVILGGLGTINGAFIGAAFILLFPVLLNYMGNNFFHGAIDATIISSIEQVVFGVLMIVFMIYEPLGMAKLWENIKLKISNLISKKA